MSPGATLVLGQGWLACPVYQIALAGREAGGAGRREGGREIGQMAGATRVSSVARWSGGHERTEVHP